eukprot:1158548-Pelagomonas_calceolata.AAC.6
MAGSFLNARGRKAKAGILVLIDAAHALGQLVIDLESLDADFYVTNCHKWLAGPRCACAHAGLFMSLHFARDAAHNVGERFS